MAEWVRFTMWDRWRDLTRFRLASEMALASYAAYVNDFPVTSASSMEIHDPSGDSSFKCDLDAFKQVLNDSQILYRTVFPSHVALTEDLARELIEQLIDTKGVARATFPGLSAAGSTADAVEKFVSAAGVEVWGDAILKAGSRDWETLIGGKAGVVEAFTVRNLLAHGVPVFNRTAVNRIAACSSGSIHRTEGEALELGKKQFEIYTATLRAFARLLADAVANLARAK